MGEALVTTSLALPNRRVGKVREVYDLPGEGVETRLVIVATDRLSAFDVVLPTALPGKGRILTDMAVFWLRLIERAGICRTHLVSTSVGEIPGSALGGMRREDLEGRVMIARRCRVVPVECVVRGYLEGSGWKEYQATGGVCGVSLPRGLRQCEKLSGAIFTPATKEEAGAHDQNISYEGAVAHLERLGWKDAGGLMARLRELSLAIYHLASAHAAARGIIIADTKFEFGVPFEEGGGQRDGRGAASEGERAATQAAEPILIDEALTPDSSRFWPADTYEPGRAQRSYDKQFVREYLEGLVSAGRWNKAAPGPVVPAEIVEKTLGRYREARDRLLA